MHIYLISKLCLFVYVIAQGYIAIAIQLIVQHSFMYLMWLLFTLNMTVPISYWKYCLYQGNIRILLCT